MLFRSGYKDISAEVRVPDPPSVDTAYATFTSNQNGDIMNGLVSIDDPSVENYYLIQAQFRFNYDTTWMNDTSWAEVQISSDDPTIDNTSNGFSQLIFSDIGFNGGKYSIRFHSNFFNSDTTGTHLRFRIFSLSRDSYLYWISLYKYYDSNGNPFAEPVQVYSNVSSGMGILGAANVVVKNIY